MNIKGLKKAIENLPDDMEVIIQKDSEGNNYSPLSDVSADCVYITENTWTGEVYDMSNDAEFYGMSDEDWEDFLSMPRAFVLCPVN